MRFWSSLKREAPSTRTGTLDLLEGSKDDTGAELISVSSVAGSPSNRAFLRWKNVSPMCGRPSAESPSNTLSNTGQSRGLSQRHAGWERSPWTAGCVQRVYSNVSGPTSDMLALNIPGSRKGVGEKVREPVVLGLALHAREAT